MGDLTREYAKRYIEKGWHVLPVDGKIPLTKQGLKDATNIVEVAEFWFAIEYAEANIAIRTGAISGLVVLDIDKKNGGLDSYEAIKDRLPATPTVRTGGGGLHLYFKHPGGDIKNSAGKIAPGIDLRGDNGYVVAPPSLHDSGARYEWEILPSEVPIADLPVFILDEKKKQPLDFGPGKRNASMVSLAGSMFREGAPAESIKAALMALGQLRPGLEEAEVDHIIEQSQNWSTPMPAMTELGQAELFSQMFGKVIAYDLQKKTWMRFNGFWWEILSSVQQYVTEAARFRRTKSTSAEELKFSTALESFNSISHVTSLSREMLALKQRELNRDPYLLGVQNGVVNLATGQLIQGTPDQWITRATTVNFDPQAQAPRWEQFIREIFAEADGTERPELVDWIWRAVGYSLTGEQSKQIWFLCLGGGSNGKGTFLGTIKAIMGGYAMKLAVRTLLVDLRRSPIANDLAAMDGIRFAITSEAGTTGELDSERLKGLVGADSTERVRELYGHEFEITPTAKIWFANNRRPRANDDSPGFWRRVRLIPFDRAFPVNAEVPKAIARETEGILAWAIRGAGEYLQRGLEAPDLVKDKTSEYQEDSDPLSGFVRERLEACDEAELNAGKAFDTYIEWALKNGISERERVGRRKFGEYLLSRFVRVHTSNGNVYRGVCLKND